MNQIEWNIFQEGVYKITRASWAKYQGTPCEEAVCELIDLVSNILYNMKHLKTENIRLQKELQRMKKRNLK
jgi:hypothetical protein